MKFKKFLIVLAAFELLVPWFFYSHLKGVVFLISGVSYVLLIFTDVLPPRKSLWWWSIFEHLGFILGAMLLFFPFYLEAPSILKVIGGSMGIFLILVFGLGARMQLIGRGNPVLEYVSKMFNLKI